MTTAYASGETPLLNDRVHWVDDPDLHLTVTELLGNCVSVRFQSGVVGRYLTSRFNLLQRDDAKPEQPPFAPKQFVRIKSSGTILNVARCEKRVVHGALRWVVDDLNGMRAFADDCDLVKNMELVNAETGQAVIHLDPQPVRYACTKVAKTGDNVKFTDRASPDPFKVVSVYAHGMCDLDFLDGEFYGTFHASKLEFVPEVTPAHPVCRGCNQPLKAENAWMSDGCPCNTERGKNHGLVSSDACTCDECKPNFPDLTPATDFDFDEAANKAATAILNSLAGTTGVSHEWASDIISAQIRPGVQQLYAKLQHRRCDTCGANTIDGCTRCGAPQCCPQCCELDELRALKKSRHVKFPSQTMGDGTQAGTLSVFARAWNGCLQTIRELNPDVKFEEACVDESRKFHLDLGLADRMQARAEQAEGERDSARGIVNECCQLLGHEMGDGIRDETVKPKRFADTLKTYIDGFRKTNQTLIDERADLTSQLTAATERVAALEKERDWLRDECERLRDVAEGF